jgi:tRNA-2-methylthio-N6-dimethylallyladenosine synthase
MARSKEENSKLKLILSGCVLDQDIKKLSLYFDLIFSVRDTSRLKQLLELDTNDHGSLDSFFAVHPAYRSDFRAYIPISFGCNNFCSYCAVPYTRGREVSRLEEDIISEVQSLIANGYKELTLLGQNVNSYGNDLGIPDAFPRLIRRIDKIPGDYRVYFYSNHPKDMTNDLIDTLSNLQHFPKYIHLPLQSGSNRIIRKMNRHYTQKKYLNLTGKIRDIIPDITFTTDIIVGFPDETEEDFLETKKVMDEVGFSMAFIAKYSPRPGTASAKMGDSVNRIEKERRFQVLTETLKNHLEKENNNMSGQILRVLIDERKKDRYYGRTDSYKVVEIVGKEKQTDLIGRFVDIEIIDTTAWKIRGKII